MSDLLPKNLTSLTPEIKCELVVDYNRLSSFSGLFQSAFQFSIPSLVNCFSAFLKNYHEVCSAPLTLVPSFDKRLLVHLCTSCYYFMKFTRQSTVPEKVRLQYEIHCTASFLERLLESL